MTEVMGTRKDTTDEQLCTYLNGMSVIMSVILNETVAKHDREKLDT